MSCEVAKEGETGIGVSIYHVDAVHMSCLSARSLEILVDFRKDGVQARPLTKGRGPPLRPVAMGEDDIYKKPNWNGASRSPRRSVCR